MSTKPILFNSEMARAILEGRKSVTRRVVKPQKGLLINGDIPDPLKPNRRLKAGLFAGGGYVLPPYQPGDILWVRETWGVWSRTEGIIPTLYYKADHDTINAAPKEIKWRPSIHMPKEAARIFLRVTGVRVERLQEITKEDIQREGVITRQPLNGFEEFVAPKAFSVIWDATIKPTRRDRYSWAANPWVWVISFERCDKPEEWP